MDGYFCALSSYVMATPDCQWLSGRRPLFIGDEIKPDTFATKPGMGDENFCVIHHVK
jgi:hypothetical protein